MLLGEYEHGIDDKNRVTLPARFRDVLADGLVLARGMEGCVAVYGRTAWDSLVAQRLDGLNPLSKQARQMGRFLFAAAADTQLDRQGRVVLPPPLVQWAKLDREVVIVGVGDHLEIWDRVAWMAELEEVEKNAELVAERLAERE